MLEEAKAKLAAKWDGEGQCSSCGWHATIGEHEIDDEDILSAINTNRGVLKLSCVNKNGYEGCRGIKIDLKL